MKSFVLKLYVFILIFTACTEMGAVAEELHGTDVSSVFVDVEKGAWYYTGVQTVYEKGIMNGTSSDMFSPDNTVTWAQAIKITSEIRSLYNGDIIKECAGPWYEKYVAYLKENNILPSSYPYDDPNKEIRRSDISNLFCNAVPEQKLPGINKCDFDDIKSDKNITAIEYLCSAGILTGKGENKFDPDGKTTRAEMSIIIDRILVPVNRVINDSAQNENMKNQMSLFDNGGLAVESRDKVFYIYKDQSNDEVIYDIISYGDDGDIKSIYTSKDAISRLSIGPDNRIYFICGKQIKSITYEGKDERVEYTGALGVNKPISYYMIYDGNLYVTELYEAGTGIADFKYRIVCVKNKKTRVIQSDITTETIGSEDFYIFNGYIYKVFSENREYGLCRIDINDGTQETVLEKIYKGDATFIGANVWYTNKVGDALEVVISPLFMPEFRYVVGTYDGLNANYTTITNKDGKAYIQVSSLMKIWEVNRFGDLKEIAYTNNGNIEKFTITRHGVVLNAKENIVSLLHNSMMMLFDASQKITYGEFLRKPAFSKTDYITQAEDKIREVPTKEPEEGKINISVKREIKKENGDLVFEFLVNNTTGNDARIDMFYVGFDGEKTRVEKRFPISLEIKNENSETFYIYIPKSEIDELNGKFKVGWKINAKLKNNV